MVTCQLCGSDFDTSDASCHVGCPLSVGCSLVCCPHCGYQVPEPSNSRALAGLRRIRDGVARALRGARPRTIDPASDIPLTSLRAGQHAAVVAVDDASPRWLHRLSSFGIVAGTPVQLVQSRPTPIVRVGQTELALDRQIARSIRVQPRG